MTDPRIALALAGDENNESQELSTANVNHLRRLVAWLECEYMLNEHSQQGMITGLHMAVAAGVEVERAQTVLDQEVARITHVPAYVRQAVRMLRKAVQDHDAKTGVIQS